MPSPIRTTTRSSTDTSTRTVWLLTLNCLVACVVPQGGQLPSAPEPAVIVVDATGAHTEVPPGPDPGPRRLK